MGVDPTRNQFSGANQIPPYLGPDQFSKLPNEIIAHILSFLTDKQICRTAAINRRFYAIATSNQVWKSILLDAFPGSFKESNTAISTYKECVLNSLDIMPISSKAMDRRKREAVARLEQIEQMLSTEGISQTMSRYKVNPEVFQFDLLSMLGRYQNPAREPSELCSDEFMQWAEVQDLMKNEFETIVKRYNHSTAFNGKLRENFQSLVEYFVQMKSFATKQNQQLILKEQFNRVIRETIKNDLSCIDQIYLKQRAMLIDILIEADAMKSGKSLTQAKLSSSAGLFLCQLGMSTVRKIIFSQYFYFNYYPQMINLERIVIPRVAENLSMPGLVYVMQTIYATYGDSSTDEAVDFQTVETILAKFPQEYNPVFRLISQLTIDVENREFRLQITNWARDYYQLDAENSRDPAITDLDRKLSADFDALPVSEGGLLSNEGALFLLLTTKILQERT
jgi:hypothetical protein